MTQKILKATTVGLAVLVLSWTAVLALQAQDKISPVSDYQYKKDYAAVETIMKEPDAGKRASALLNFVKQRPISRSLSYIAQSYLAALAPQIQAKDWAKVVAAEEAFVAVMPTEDLVKKEQVPEPGAGEFINKELKPSQKMMQQNIIAANFQSGDMAKAAELAEKAYNADPNDKQMLQILLTILQKSSPEKYLAMTEKLANESPIDQSFGTFIQLADEYAKKGNLDKAVEYSSKVMQAFGDKVPQGVQETDWNGIRAKSYGYMAAAAYGKKDYAKAVPLYEKVGQYAPKSDTPYYYLGMCKWQTQDQEGAIPFFAKAVVLGNKKAQNYLEQLYKARHNDSLDGLDQVMAKAKADLGVN
jgi:tetratricopeptide (TPR) repeat protein